MMMRSTSGKYFVLSINTNTSLPLLPFYAWLASGLLSFLVIQPSYKASTIIAVSQMGGPQLTPTSNMEEVVSKLAEVPQLNTASYARQVKVPVVLKQAVEKLNEMGYEEQELTIPN
jgi:capsular polysaccharide biosynthesis protein